MTKIKQSAGSLGRAIGRRQMLQAAAAIGGIAGLGVGTQPARAAGSLKVGTYGGYFKDSFDEHIYPDFTKETGIEVQSIAEPTGEAWLVQLQTAARAGAAPADVSMMAQVARIKGQNANLWAELDESKLPNIKNLRENFVHRYPDGKISGIGAVSWYVTLATNTDAYSTAPQSWKALWDKQNAGKLGLMALASNSFLLEITAQTWFGGTDILKDEAGVTKVMDKLKELVPDVQLWWRDEGQFQQALQSGETPMGEYYHDVTELAASKGEPVRSTFPKEGGILDSGSWCVVKTSKALDEACIFIDYMCRPQVQATLARKVGTSPTVKRELTDLTAEEFAAVGSDIPPIIPRYDLYVEKDQWVSQKWNELIGG